MMKKESKITMNNCEHELNYFLITHTLQKG